MKHEQSTSARELIQKIDNHPDRHALQQDLRQNQAYNPFSSKSKKMIQDVFNIELCELLETDPKNAVHSMPVILECRHLLLHVRHFLQKETEVNRKFVKYTMDLLSLPEYVIKKGRPHGHRYGKSQEKEYYLANQLKKKCKKKKFQGIHDRFLRDHVFRGIENNRDEEVCRRWDVLADEDHTYHLSEIEYFYDKNKWWPHSNKSGSDTLPLRKRSDFKQALSTLERLHQEAGEEPFVPTYSYKHKQRQSASSSSSTWWKWQDSWWSSYNSESQGRGKQKSWERTVRPVIDSILAKTSEDGFQEFNLFCYRWIVYS